MTHPGPPQQAARSLPIGKTAAAAYRAVFGQLPALGRAAFVPYLISLALWALGELATLLITPNTASQTRPLLTAAAKT